MADVAMTTAAEPDGAPRIAVLDILRGVAILGILFMNINDMGGSIWATFDDVRHFGWSATDQMAWWLRELFANGTARGLLEMLFGAGMVILTDRVAAVAGEWIVLRRYYARNLVLWLFGLVHLFVLLWPGDILHTYGIAALLVFLVRRLPPEGLILFGLAFAGMQLLNGTAGYVHGIETRAAVAAIEARRAAGHGLTVADRATLTSAAQEHADAVAARQEIARQVHADDHARTAATGSFTSWTTTTWSADMFLFTSGLELSFVEEAASAMCLGMALFKLGIIQGMRSRRFYLAMTVSAYVVGLTLRAIGAYETTRFDDAPHVSWATGEIARLAMTLGHIGLINLLAGTAFGTKLLRPFVAAGRTALSIYIAQTLICLWVLYPPFMLGLYGTMTWGPLMVTAFVINAVLLVGANLWVRQFDIAPVEWAWRSLVERRMLPWRKRSRGVGVTTGSPAAV